MKGGYCKDPTLAHMLRCLFLEAKFDLILSACHVPGVENGVALIFQSSSTGTSGTGSCSKGTSSTPGNRHSLDIQRLEGLARDLVNEPLAPSTKRVYTTGQKRYLDFCSAGHLTLFPLTEDQLCTFVAHLMDKGLQHSSIKGYLSAIRRLQIVHGLGDPFTASWPLLEYTLRGIKLHQAKHRDTRPKTRLPISYED